MHCRRKHLHLAQSEMAQFDGMTAAVPVDGWTQMVVYRKDLFDAAGLAAPNSYANIEAAVDALHNPPSMYGFVAPNKVDENFMSQVLEHVFLLTASLLSVLMVFQCLTKDQPLKCWISTRKYQKRHLQVSFIGNSRVSYLSQVKQR